MPDTVAVIVYEHRHGNDISVCADEDVAVTHHLAQLMKGNIDELRDDTQEEARRVCQEGTAKEIRQLAFEWCELHFRHDEWFSVHRGVRIEGRD